MDDAASSETVSFRTRATILQGEIHVPSQLSADIQPEELKAVLAHYDLGKIRSLDRQNKGSRRSPKIVVTSDRGKFLLKRRAKGRDHPMKVAYAHSVQRYLADHDFPIAPLITTRDDDDTMVILNERIYELFEYLPGSLFDRSVEATQDAGRVLGQFHELLSRFESDWEPSRRGFHDSNPVRSSLNGIPSSIGKNDSVAGKETELLGTVSSLYDSYELAAEVVNDAGFYEWPSQLVHADWHPGNMLFNQGSVEAVIDYDSLRLLPPVTDLANGVLQFSIIGGSPDPREWPAQLDEDRLRAFLQGYEEEGVVTPEQLKVMPWLMIEALVAEAVTPIAATGSFGRIEGFRFMQMICRKVRWLEHNGKRLTSVSRV